MDQQKPQGQGQSIGSDQSSSQQQDQRDWNQLSHDEQRQYGTRENYDKQLSGGQSGGSEKSNR